MGRHMDASGSRDANREYYDAFSAEYERERGSNDPGGYHELLDELEADYVRRFGSGRDATEGRYLLFLPRNTDKGLPCGLGN